MLFTSKNFMFSNFTWKKKLAPVNGEEGDEWISGWRAIPPSH